MIHALLHMSKADIAGAKPESISPTHSCYDPSRWTLRRCDYAFSVGGFEEAGFLIRRVTTNLLREPMAQIRVLIRSSFLWEYSLPFPRFFLRLKRNS